LQQTYQSIVTAMLKCEIPLRHVSPVVFGSCALREYNPLILIASAT